MAGYWRFNLQHQPVPPVLNLPPFWFFFVFFPHGRRRDRRVKGRSERERHRVRGTVSSTDREIQLRASVNTHPCRGSTPATPQLIVSAGSAPGSVFPGETERTRPFSWDSSSLPEAPVNSPNSPVFANRARPPGNLIIAFLLRFLSLSRFWKGPFSGGWGGVFSQSLKRL